MGKSGLLGYISSFTAQLSHCQVLELCKIMFMLGVIVFCHTPFNDNLPSVQSFLTILRGQGGQKRGDNKHHNTIQRTPVGTGKHELITTITSHVHNIIEKSNREKESKVRKGVTDEVPQQSKPIAA